MNIKRLALACVLVVATATAALAQSFQQKTLSTTVCPGAGCINLDTGGSGSVGVQVTGTFSGTLQFEQSLDGTNWVAWSVFPSGIVTGTAVTSTTSTGLWVGPSPGLRQVRVRFSSFVSGSAVVSAVGALAAARPGVTGASSFPSAIPASTCPAPSLGESGAATTGIAFTATPSILGCVGGTERSTLTAAGLTLTVPELVDLTALGTTSTSGLSLRNTTAATGGATVQISPRLLLQGSAWDTAASQTVAHFLETLPLTAATPTSKLKFGYSLNGAVAVYPAILANSVTTATFSVGTGFDPGDSGVNGEIVVPGGGSFALYNNVRLRSQAAGVFKLENFAETAAGFLAVEANDHFFQRNGTNAQRLSVANTYTSSSNNELFSVDWQTQANNALVGTRTAATGTARSLQLGAQNSNGSNAYSVINLSGTSIGFPLFRLGFDSSAGVSQSITTAATMASVVYTHTGTSGAVNIFAITPTYNQTSGTAANTDLLINRTQTAVGSGAQYLIDAQVSTASKFSVTNTGAVMAASTSTATSFTATATTALIVSGASKLFSTSDGTWKWSPNAATTGVGVDFSADGIVGFKNFALTGNAQLYAASVRGVAVAFASLPATPVEGMIVAVTNSSTNAWGAACDGAGANHVLCYYNGSAWNVIGK